MSSNGHDFKFDSNYFANLTSIPELEDSERRNSELSFEINEDELLKELEILSPSSTKGFVSSKKTTDSEPARNYSGFSAIRTGPEDIGDYNVENMVLTPEDENNPELLAELDSLIITKVKSEPIKERKEGESRSSLSDEPFDLVAELKREILILKRNGDLEGAKTKLKELNAIETPRNESKIEAKSEEIITRKQMESSLTSPAATSPKLKASDAQVYRDLFAKLQKQSASCASVSEFYTAAGRKSDANLFIKRKQALDLELQKLRLSLKNKQPAPQCRTVNVTYEYVLSNPDIAEGQMNVSIGQLKVLLPRKFKLKDTEEYRLRVFYELFGLEAKEMTLTSEPFTTQGLSKNSLGPFVFKCNKKDLRLIKSVEYKKMRLEILATGGFLFFKSDVIKMTGQCKLDRLTKDCSMKEEVELFDVEEGKKSAIPSASILLTAKIRSPLTSDGFKQCTEKWIVIPDFGYSNHTLYSDLSPPLATASIPVVQAVKSGTIADQIKSFEVIEYELGQLSENQAAVLADQSLMDLQVALEALRDQMQMKVELGQISLEDYLNSVRQSIEETKKLALEAKKGGDLQSAKRYVKHVDIMRKEVAEAEANMASEEQ